MDKGFLYYGIVNLMFYNKYIIHFYLQIISGRRSQFKKIILVAFKLLKCWISHNLGLTVAQSDTLTLSSYKNATMLRMLLISFIHITEKKRNITRKYGERCYTKYRVHQCNGKIWITSCTRARVTTNLNNFSQVF